MGNTLINITRQMHEIETKLLECNGEIDENLTKELVQFEENQAVLKSKVDSYHYIIEKSKDNAKFWKKRADEITRIQKSFEQLEKNLKSMLKVAMNNLNVKEIKGEDYNFKLQNSKASIVYNEKEIPDIYKRQIVTTEIDKKAIQDEISMGNTVEGVTVIENKSMRCYLNKREK